MENRYRAVTDKEADDSLRPLEALEVDVAAEFSSCSAMSKTGTGSAYQRDHKLDNLSAGELKLVRVVVRHPMRASSEYPKLARISPNTFQKARPLLISRGLIREHKLESGGRGRSTILLEPLPAAIELVSANENGVAMGG
ncbi:unnamed protein product [marine sediment metagenome]|uniref:HTH marR-type domain-containing protein n=1 Tax=marine sediment metagenome TaxID=412755 RepID=X1HYD2_9ZZZZ